MDLIALAQEPLFGDSPSSASSSAPGALGDELLSLKPKSHAEQLRDPELASSLSLLESRTSRAVLQLLKQKLESSDSASFIVTSSRTTD